jgi:hypothetical protein
MRRASPILLIQRGASHLGFQCHIFQQGVSVSRLSGRRKSVKINLHEEFPKN